MSSHSPTLSIAYPATRHEFGRWRPIGIVPHKGPDSNDSTFVALQEHRLIQVRKVVNDFGGATPEYLAARVASCRSSRLSSQG